MAKFVSFQEIPIEKIHPSKFQSRTDFSEDSINGLMISVYEQGILEPLVVRPSGDGFELIDGERRLRAAKKAHLDTVPCIIRDSTDEETPLDILVANSQREDLNIYDRSNAIILALKVVGTQQALAVKSGLGQQYISSLAEIKPFMDKHPELTPMGVNLTPHDFKVTAGMDDNSRLRLLDLKSREEVKATDLPLIARALKGSDKLTESQFVKSPTPEMVASLIQAGSSIEAQVAPQAPLNIEIDEESEREMEMQKTLSDIRSAVNIIRSLKGEIINTYPDNIRLELVRQLRIAMQYMVSLGVVPE